MPAGAAYISTGEIITAASDELRDSGCGMLGHGFYLSAAQRAVEQMNYATQFHKAIFETDIPENLIVELPGDLTEKDYVWLYRGDGCNITQSTILFIKPGMYHKGGTGYLANNKGSNPDPMQFSLSWSQAPPARLYFAGEYNGSLYLSPSCLARWERLHIRYSGLGVDCFGADFKVPHWAREAVTDFVIHKCALALEREDPNFYARVIARKENEMKSLTGSWWKAVGQYKKMDRKARYDITAYTFDTGHYI